MERSSSAREKPFSGEMFSLPPSFYFERDYDAQDARQAVKDAEFVLEAVKRLLGLQ